VTIGSRFLRWRAKAAIWERASLFGLTMTAAFIGVLSVGSLSFPVVVIIASAIGILMGIVAGVSTARQGRPSERGRGGDEDVRPR
jgi:hypothetical protein